MKVYLDKKPVLPLQGLSVRIIKRKYRWYRGVTLRPIQGWSVFFYPLGCLMGFCPCQYERRDCMKEQLQMIADEAMAKMEEVQDIKSLEEIRVLFLGKKGKLTGILKGMGTLSAQERPIIGQMANDVRNRLEDAIQKTRSRLAKKEREERMARETIDVTMPGTVIPRGKKHPLTLVLDEIKEVFIGMGYEIAEGPEVELDYYNFEALNIPKNNSARDEQDTFYINDKVVLRTQTSSVQVRVMEKKSHQ